jgi:hypothetical protein
VAVECPHDLNTIHNTLSHYKSKTATFNDCLDFREANLHN